MCIWLDGGKGDAVIKKKKISGVISLRHVWEAALDAVHTVSRDQITVYAAQATFFIIISSIPFLLLLLSLTKYFINADWLLQLIKEHITGDVGRLLEGIVGEIVNKGGISLVSVTVITTLWSSSKGVNAVMRGISGAYGIKLKENFLYDIFRSLFYTIAFIVLIVAVLAALVFADTIRGAAEDKIPVLAAIFRIISRGGKVVLTVVLTLFFALLFNTVAKKGKRLSKSEYHVLSDKLPRGYAAQLPGAFFAALGWVLFSYFYSLYLSYFPNASYVYGSLAAIVFLLLWLYFCMIILMLGAEVNKLVFLHGGRKKAALAEDSSADGKDGKEENRK